MKIYHLLGMLVLILLGAAWVTNFNFGVIHEGSINEYANCNAQVVLDKGDWETYLHKFYCSPAGTYGKSCDAVEYDSTGACIAHYFYFTNPQP